MQDVCTDLGVDDAIHKSLQGVVFEIRQGYKSKDAKRQNADIANAATAYTQAYMPCVLMLSTQIDPDIAARYRHEKWLILIGNTASNSATDSTYVFMRKIVRFDLAAFFERHRRTLHDEVDKVLNKLLSTRSK